MESEKRLLIVSTAILAVIGIGILTVLLIHKSQKPRFGWATLGDEHFALQPAAHHSFSYSEVPARFKLQVNAQQPLSFGFVTPDTFGHFTHTVMDLDFASLPCGSAPVATATKECATEPSKRYLLFSDPREDAVPDGKGLRVKTAPPLEEGALNHVTVRMYEWRCLAYCENLPPGATAQ